MMWVVSIVFVTRESSNPVESGFSAIAGTLLTGTTPTCKCWKLKALLKDARSHLLECSA